MCSRDVKIAGLLGSAASLEAKSSAVAEQQVGLGGTTKWRLASLVSHATMTHGLDGCLVVYALGISHATIAHSLDGCLVVYAMVVSHATITYSFPAVDGCLVVYAMGMSGHHRLAEGLFYHKHLASYHCNQYFVCTFWSNKSTSFACTVCTLHHGKTHVD